MLELFAITDRLIGLASQGRSKSVARVKIECRGHWRNVTLYNPLLKKVHDRVQCSKYPFEGVECIVLSDTIYFNK